MASVTLRNTKFALVLLICLSDLLNTPAQFYFPPFGRSRKCSPHKPPPVNVTYNLRQCRREVASVRSTRNPEAKKRTSQIVVEHGYDLENHTVISDDGYILSLHRVPGGPKSPIRRGKPAVLLYHGLGSVSDSWFVLPSNKNLVFKLVDAGYDVWLANGRGSDLSQGHVKKATHRLAYWEFSFHEMGVYDLPATVDLILRETGNEKIFYIGHSQGGTIFLVGTSEVPELNDKIYAAFLFAPAAFLGRTYMGSLTMLLRFLYTPVETMLYRTFRGRVEMRARRDLFAFFAIEALDICSVRALQCDLCDNAFFNFFDFNPSQANFTNTPNIFKLLNTASVKSFIHFGQNIVSCQFRKFDYGKAENLQRYGSREPPSYRLDKIRAPVHIFYGDQDSFVPVPDIMQLVDAFDWEVLRGLHRVQDDTFDHCDFTTGRDADKLVYANITEMLAIYCDYEDLQLR